LIVGEYRRRAWACQTHRARQPVGFPSQSRNRKRSSQRIPKLRKAAREMRKRPSRDSRQNDRIIMVALACAI
jgi:hypothetical protein